MQVSTAVVTRVIAIAALLVGIAGIARAISVVNQHYQENHRGDDDGDCAQYAGNVQAERHSSEAPRLVFITGAIRGLCEN